MPPNFEPWLDLWSLTPDGEPFVTPYAGSRLLPVRQGSTAAMLKLAASDDERRGGAVMEWWNGVGAAPVLAREGEALLMVRAEGERTLHREDNATATAILCAAVDALHRRWGGRRHPRRHWRIYSRRFSTPRSLG